MQRYSGIVDSPDHVERDLGLGPYTTGTITLMDDFCQFNSTKNGRRSWDLLATRGHSLPDSILTSIISRRHVRFSP
jgi:hypothetical protein